MVYVVPKSVCLASEQIGMEEIEDDEEAGWSEENGKKHIKIHPIGNCGCNKMAKNDDKFLGISVHEFCHCLSIPIATHPNEENE